MFRIDFLKLLTIFLPTFLRYPIVTAWLLALSSPIIGIYRLFISKREDDLFRCSIDSTIPRLEYMLNYIFYQAGLNIDYNGRIRIETARSKPIVALYLGGITQQANEDKPLYILDDEPLYLDSLAETGAMGNDFTVLVPPAAQPYNEARMRSLIHSYALADKSFTIINL